MSDRIPTVEGPIDAGERLAHRQTPAYQTKQGIYTRGTSGFFQNVRLTAGLVMLFMYYLFPWLNWGDQRKP